MKRGEAHRIHRRLQARFLGRGWRQGLHLEVGHPGLLPRVRLRTEQDALGLQIPRGKQNDPLTKALDTATEYFKNLQNTVKSQL